MLYALPYKILFEMTINGLCMKKILSTIISLLLMTVLVYADKKPDISLVYGGIYNNKMVVFFHIKTPEGIKTYWQTPGFGGIAPEFSFDKNLEVHNLEISYGVPNIYSKNGLINYILDQDDYIAVTFQPENPNAPILFKGNMTYGYCDTLCKSDTFQFAEIFTISQPVNDTLLEDFFTNRPHDLKPEQEISVENLSADYTKRKNLLISFNLKGIDNINHKNLIYYIDTDFEIKKPIIRKTQSDNYQISFDLYNIYERPKTLTLMFPDDGGKYTISKHTLTFKDI